MATDKQFSQKIYREVLEWDANDRAFLFKLIEQFNLWCADNGWKIIHGLGRTPMWKQSLTGDFKKTSDLLFDFIRATS